MFNHTSTSSSDVRPSIRNPLKLSLWIWYRLWSYINNITLYLFGFLITAIAIWMGLGFFVYFAKDVVSQALIILDYLFSLLIAYFVFRRDINIFIDHKKIVFDVYCEGEIIVNSNSVDHNVLLSRTVWFLALITILGLTAFIINLTLPDNSFGREHSWYKFLKFGICQFIMLNIVFSFSALTNKFHMDDFERTFKFCKELFQLN